MFFMTLLFTIFIFLKIISVILLFLEVAVCIRLCWKRHKSICSPPSQLLVNSRGDGSIAMIKQHQEGKQNSNQIYLKINLVSFPVHVREVGQIKSYHLYVHLVITVVYGFSLPTILIIKRSYRLINKTILCGILSPS